MPLRLKLSSAGERKGPIAAVEYKHCEFLVGVHTKIDMKPILAHQNIDPCLWHQR